MVSGERMYYDCCRVTSLTFCDSRQLCSLCFCASNPSNSIGCNERHYWVRLCSSGPPKWLTRRSAILASWFLKEELGPIGRVGCGLCVLGSLIIILHAPEDKNIQTVDEILQYAIQPGITLVLRWESTLTM